jgi:SpoVK/Ycf46/Vps4 family AAA+-type ATPase
MNYSIEIGKIVEGALKNDKEKLENYTKLLIEKLRADGENRTAEKFNKLLLGEVSKTLSPMNITGKTVPVDTESRTPLADVILPGQNDSFVVLSEQNKTKLNSFILNYKNADKLNTLGLGISNTLILYGPPGCGKTKCAYYIAKELNLPLVIARLDSMISSYLGTTAKNIRYLFEYIQRMPCVLFLDEFDALAKARDDSNELGELKRVVNSLLQNIDTMSSDSLLIAATNHDQLLDTAVWRRFDYKLKVELPDTKAIRRLLDIFISDKLPIESSQKDLLAIAFAGLSGATVEEIVKKTIRDSVIAGKECTYRDIFFELFLYKGFTENDVSHNKESLKNCIRFLHDLGKPFTYDVITEITGISSKSMITPLLNEEKGVPEHGEKSTNQNHSST